MEVVHHAQALLDPVARKTAWSPLAGWVYHFKTHALVRTNADQWQLRPRFRTHLQNSIFGLIGVAVVVIALVIQSPPPRFTIFLGVAILLFGIWHHLKEGRTIIVDELAGSVQWRTLFIRSAARRPHALQLLSCRLEARPVTEVNFVFENGERLCVLSNSDLEYARLTSQAVAQLLRVPTWQGPVAGQLTP